MIQIYFAAGKHRWPDFHVPLTKALDDIGLNANISPNCDDPAKVDYIVFAPGGDIDDFAPFVNAKAVLSLWAGVEKIVGNASLTQPLCRMVDPGLTSGMVEWVTGHTLRHHLGMDRHILNPNHIWQPVYPPLASERPVAMLGMGALGQACARALQGLGFPVTGWSRTEKSLPDLTCLHGDDGLRAALVGASIVVLLLPKTLQTDNILNAQSLAYIPKGAFIINPGRGHLIDDAALLAALDNGHIAHATLDVFRTEPLPPDHPFWHHPQITVTPHVAAETRPETASAMVAENIRRGQSGLPFLNLVNRERGY